MKRFLNILLCLILLSSLLAGCSETAGTTEDSPVLSEAEITSFSEGKEDAQFADCLLTFDRPVRVNGNGESLRITIAGARKTDFSITQGNTDSQILIRIPTTAATNGILQIGISEKAKAITDITSSDGRNPVQDFTVEGSIPSGVSLQTVSRVPGKVIKEVTHAWNIRSIAWIGLYENGALIPVSETNSAEMLEGHAAVHGHEFIIENEKDVAEKIVETLNRNYGSGYHFSSDGTSVTAEKENSDAALDLCLLRYIEINGERSELTDISTDFTEDSTASAGEQTDTPEEHAELSEEHNEASEEHEHDHGDIIRHSASDREISGEEQTLLSLLPSADYENTGITPETADGTALYQTLTLTGKGMPETQIYSVMDLEELLRLSYSNEAMMSFALPAQSDGYFGIDLFAFLSLCGADMNSGTGSLLIELDDGTEQLLSPPDLAGSVLALADENGALETGAPDSRGAFCIVLAKEKADNSNRFLNNVRKILVSKAGEKPEDPGYGYHDHEPYLDSEDLTFTIEIYQNGAEYLGAVKTVSYTTKDLEDLMIRNPDHVDRGYYSTIGNAENFKYVGIGSWFDYFEGPDLLWLLTEVAGITKLSGRAELYDRDLELFEVIDDLTYFTEAHEKSYEYYTLTADGLELHGMIPMIGLIKNGAPILKDHTHEGPGYIAYNTLNETLNAAGIGTEIGVIKNHNGPFIACFGNRSGYYGGNEVETGNNCVLMKLYLNELPD